MDARSPQPLLEVEGICRSFGALVAVDDVSLRLGPREILGIAGPNGAGKTTLFNVITGIPFKADKGRITFRGTRIEAMAPHRIFRLGLARTFQKETSFANLTVEQNVRLGAAFGADLRGKELAAAVDRALERLDLSARRRDPAASLTVYGTKRLMLASAIVTRPPLLMLDEPASGLTASEVADLKSLILGFRDDGMAILLIEHILPLLFGISERVMVMDFGRKLVEGTPADVARDQRVIDAYLGGQSEGAADALAG
ncbi:ABC transporter ATP-binding protein [Labrys monachus]|uniref:Branched-chain amino acid transport system ATP-binding protein n=1 Tax=Labrys monachus TaxID=217067 RepID=A0ABU0FII1_9HYPH|nr:ABC transporter ATP-binding protein [Labrys monachus]MDQ0394419.1 branched-chain amino acid transport system ATP-binding protein [Labrys monachus]